MSYTPKNPENPDKHDCRRLMGQAYGNWYWAKHGIGDGPKPKAERVRLILEYRKWRKLIETAPVETNERGNTIYRDGDADVFLGIQRGEDRYYYDFEAFGHDWKQYDTRNDASYWGMWVNLERLMTFTYCEGDRCLVVCPDKEHLKAELEDAARFYGDPPPFARAYSRDGSVTEYYDTRPEVTL